MLQKVEIWTGVTNASLTHSLTTLKDSATQLLIKYKSGALVTQLTNVSFMYVCVAENAELLVFFTFFYAPSPNIII